MDVHLECYADDSHVNLGISPNDEVHIEKRGIEGTVDWRKDHVVVADGSFDLLLPPHTMVAAEWFHGELTGILSGPACISASFYSSVRVVLPTNPLLNLQYDIKGSHLYVNGKKKTNRLSNSLFNDALKRMIAAKNNPDAIPPKISSTPEGTRATFDEFMLDDLSICRETDLTYISGSRYVEVHRKQIPLPHYHVQNLRRKRVELPNE